jgi:hypothetical protein
MYSLLDEDEKNFRFRLAARGLVPIFRDGKIFVYKV